MAEPFSPEESAEVTAAIQEALDAAGLGPPKPRPFGVGISPAEMVAVSPGPGPAAPGADVLGSLTGAPPHTQTMRVPVRPFDTQLEPVRLIDAARYSRSVIVTAPAVAFGVFIGGSGVSPTGQGVRVTPGLPYEFILPGGQDLYAVTDAAAPLPVYVQVAPLLIGDRERKAPPLPAS